MTIVAYLPERGVIDISGLDRVGFLQGLVSNDVTKTRPGACIWAALLTPQGRYRAEMFIFATDSSLLLDAPREAIADIIARLSRFKLRSKVTLTDRSPDFAVHAAWDGDVDSESAIAAPDPRLPTAGTRIIAPHKLPNATKSSAYRAHRVQLGLPDHADLEPDKTLPVEAGFGELHGIDWNKGCYMGQELTARTRYRGLIKRRLIPIDAASILPPSGRITAGDRDVGDLRTAAGQRGLAFLRLDALDQPLRIGTLAITPALPDWLTLSAASEKAPA
ncbi:MAG: folate-binding protein [Acidiphilium sp.]|nr:folate-binding protein [Acidiphilium sp.]MDD4934453.1 folate-binding protein [Acidiphilium sp.]